MNLEPFELKIWHTFISKESTDFMASKKAHYLLFALDFSLSYKIINSIDDRWKIDRGRVTIV